MDYYTLNADTYFELLENSEPELLGIALNPHTGDWEEIYG